MFHVAYVVEAKKSIWKLAISQNEGWTFKIEIAITFNHLILKFGIFSHMPTHDAFLTDIKFNIYYWSGWVEEHNAEPTKRWNIVAAKSSPGDEPSFRAGSTQSRSMFSL